MTARIILFALENQKITPPIFLGEDSRKLFFNAQTLEELKAELFPGEMGFCINQKALVFKSKENKVYACQFLELK